MWHDELPQEHPITAMYWELSEREIKAGTVMFWSHAVTAADPAAYNHKQYMWL